MRESSRRAGEAFAALCDLMADLRAPEGCPWDREQSLSTLRSYLVEEAYEVLDVMTGAPEAHCEELGDLLFQIVFHAQIRAEQGQFHAADVARGIEAKMRRRHPHVFGDVAARSAAEVPGHWEAQKAQERRGESVLDHLPRALPALLLAARTGAKAANLGFDWTDVAGVRAKVLEELREVDEAYERGQAHAIEDEIGDLLFAVANWARWLDVDSEAALRGAIAKFHRRFKEIEPALRKDDAGRRMSLDALNALWEDAKRRTRGP